MALDTLIGFIILIPSIIVHEVAHGYAANAQGDPTARLSGRLTLNPLAHVDLMGSLIIPAFLVFTGSPIFFGWAKPVPYNPYNLRNQRWGEAFVALAGSLTNLLLAVIFGLFIRYGTLFGASLPMLNFAAMIAYVNLFLGLFNLFPFPPLDGFTVLRAVLPWPIASRLTAFAHQLAGMGIFALIAFLLVFSIVVTGPFSLLVSRIFGLITGIGI